MMYNKQRAGQKEYYCDLARGTELYNLSPSLLFLSPKKSSSLSYKTTIIVNPLISSIYKKRQERKEVKR